MAIRWSANKLSEALDEIEKQISLAESFFEEAKKKAKEKLSEYPTCLSTWLKVLAEYSTRLNG